MSILFDLDGTLLDTAPDFLLALNAFRKEIGLLPLADSTLPAIRIAVSHGIESILALGLEDPEASSKKPLLKEALLGHYFPSLGQAARPFPGIELLLHTLEAQGIPWGIVTNKIEKFTIPLLEKLALKHRAACIISGDTTPHAKPHPFPLLHACQQIGIAPQQCVYIGDTERDILAGKYAGMTTIGALFGYIENPEAAKQWGAHHYVQHAHEIWPWYQKWQLSLTRF